MAIKPFSATYYNPRRFRNYSSLICPPYDVISKKELKGLRKKSPYNFSKVLVADDGNYRKIGKILSDWENEGVLIKDEQDCFYIYEQKFKLEGKQKVRFGIISLIKMDQKGVFPHEKTLRGPKEDRKRIIRATEANLSPIFVISGKPLKELHKVYEKARKTKPFSAFMDSKGITNRIWRIADKKVIKKLQTEAQTANLLIADGHHRFAISLDYYKRNKNKFPDLNYVLAYITDSQSGLCILPTHRVVAIDKDKAKLFKRIEKYFKIKEVTEKFIEKKLKTYQDFFLGLYLKNKYYFLELKNPDILGTISKTVYAKVDTYIFHKLILPEFKISGDIEYTHSVSEAKLLAKQDKCAFLLRPISLDAVSKISSKGYKFPQKSTYFYPKVLSGIVMRRFQS